MTGLSSQKVTIGTKNIDWASNLGLEMEFGQGFDIQSLVGKKCVILTEIRNRKNKVSMVIPWRKT